MDDFFQMCQRAEFFTIQKKLQLTNFELFFHNYPPPFTEGFIHLPAPSRDKQISLPNMYALDCEMIITKAPDGQLWKELARVSVVDHNLDVVFDVLVKPAHEVSDYLTEFSGLTAELMADAELSLQDVQDMFMDNFDSTTIFVGHSLEADLRTLQICHFNVMDTAVLHCRKYAKLQKPKLKFLCSLHLNRLIQTGSGHDSIEDAKAAMILALYFLIEPVILSQYHLPHGQEASNFFESCAHYFQINVILASESVIWFEDFVSNYQLVLDRVSSKHPEFTLTLSPYYYFMPNFEVGDNGLWGNSFFIGIKNKDPTVCKSNCTKAEVDSLEESFNEAFDFIFENLQSERITMIPSFLQHQCDVPIWVWQPTSAFAISPALTSQDADDSGSSCTTVVPTQSPSASSDENLNWTPGDPPTTEVCAANDILDSSRDFVPFALVEPVLLNRRSGRRNRKPKKTRRKRNRRRNNKKHDGDLQNEP